MKNANHINMMYFQVNDKDAQDMIKRPHLFIKSHSYEGDLGVSDYKKNKNPRSKKF